MKLSFNSLEELDKFYKTVYPTKETEVAIENSNELRDCVIIQETDARNVTIKVKFDLNGQVYERQTSIPKMTYSEKDKGEFIRSVVSSAFLDKFIDNIIKRAMNK